MKAVIKGAALGAVVAALAVVAVYESRSGLASDPGGVVVAGREREQARVPPPLPAPAHTAEGAQPAPSAGIAAGRPEAADAEALRGALAAARARTAALEQEVARLKSEVADERALRVEVEGEAPSWPPAMPEKYSADNLRQNFEAALKELGYDGEVTEVDCTEYPCIVYGKLNDHDGTQLDQLEQADALAMYRGSANNTSAWGGVKKDAQGEHKEAIFGIAVHPREDDEVRKSQITKRLTHRHQQFWDAIRAQKEENPAP